jgi:hypothetical protein
MKQITEQSGWDLLKSGEVTIETPKSDEPITKKDTDNNSDKKKYNIDRDNTRDNTNRDNNLDIKSSDKKIKNPINKTGKLVRAPRTKKDWINPDLIRDLQIATRNARIGNVEISFAQSGHDKYVDGKSVVSRHMNGTGVDISVLNGIGYPSNPKLFTILGNIFVEELKKLGYRKGEGPNKKAYVWQSTEHFNHIHVSNTSNSKNPKDVVLQNLPTTDQLKYHQVIKKAIADMYNVITTTPDAYFSSYLDYLSPNDTKDAANHLKNGFNAAWDINFKTVYDKAHKQDQYNILRLRNVIKAVYNYILSGKQDTYVAKFKFYNKLTLQWEDVVYKFKWDYL